MNQDLFQHLRSAFIAEAMTVLRFTHFAQAAQIEGQPETARLFADLAETAICVAHGHLDFLQAVADPASGLPAGDTESNLAAAIASETEAATTRYPLLAERAHAAGLADVASWLETLSALKRSQADRLGRQGC